MRIFGSYSDIESTITPNKRPQDYIILEVSSWNQSVQLSGGRIFLNCADEVAIEILRRTSGIEQYLDQLQCNQCEKQLIEFSLESLI